MESYEYDFLSECIKKTLDRKDIVRSKALKNIAFKLTNIENVLKHHDVRELLFDKSVSGLCSGIDESIAVGYNNVIPRLREFRTSSSERLSPRAVEFFTDFNMYKRLFKFLSLEINDKTLEVTECLLDIINERLPYIDDKKNKIDETERSS